MGDLQIESRSEYTDVFPSEKGCIEIRIAFVKVRKMDDNLLARIFISMISSHFTGGRFGVEASHT